MIKNSLGRELPERIGDYIVKPYMGPNATPASDTPVVTRRTSGHRIPGESKTISPPCAKEKAFKTASRLVDEGAMVISSGGGGIPVIRDENGKLVGR